MQLALAGGVSPSPMASLETMEMRRSTLAVQLRVHHVRPARALEWTGAVETRPGGSGVAGRVGDHCCTRLLLVVYLLV